MSWDIFPDEVEDYCDAVSHLMASGAVTENMLSCHIMPDGVWALYDPKTCIKNMSPMIVQWAIQFFDDEYDTDNKEPPTWGYKPIDERSGPTDLTCPPVFFDCAFKSNNSFYNREWRHEVLRAHDLEPKKFRVKHPDNYEKKPGDLISMKRPVVDFSYSLKKEGVNGMFMSEKSGVEILLDNSLSLFFGDAVIYSMSKISM